ncbi:MAG TPA: N-acetylornithine carbamoyltransferase [Planctomycetes bacterium]|nr:N-acetylornithine carbamoyltransferase [Planctomycetota bacterium]
MSFANRDFLGLADYAPDEVRFLIGRALDAKRGKRLPSLAGKTLAAIFFNPSLRTRLSFQIAMDRLGGRAILVNAGSEVWAIEYGDGAVMDGDTSEHVKEAARVLDRYVDALAIRAFPQFKSWDRDREDVVIRSFAREAKVPVINMESAIEHPCQGLADAVTIAERLGETKGRPFCLTWAWHPKALPLAVPHSALLAAAHLGMEVRLACPPGYEPDPDVLGKVKTLAADSGGGFQTFHDQAKAIKGARVVYAKSWASIARWGDAEAEKAARKDLRAWQVTGKSMRTTADGFFMHCLPVRRNVVVADEVLDGPACAVYDEAENRIWAQMAVLSAVVGR